MAPPSPLAIATSSVQRLVNEEASYHKELKQQEGRLERLLTNKDEDENAEYQLKQERTAIEETKAVFPSLRQRLVDALLKLQDQFDAAKEGGASADELAKAEDVIEKAKAATSEK